MCRADTRCAMVSSAVSAAVSESLHNTTVKLEPFWNYLVNPGSVGQPRDGDPRAAFILYDPLERAISLQRVAYDVSKAQSKIRARGLPDFLAARLAEGQ